MAKTAKNEDKGKDKHAGGRLLSETEKAYIAGIIDGEGCIYLGKHKNRSVKYSDYVYSSGISVEMGCEAVPRWLSETIGCLLSFRERYDRGYKMWLWKASGLAAEDILLQIYPYLVEKKKEADIFLEFRESVRKKHNNRRIKLTLKETEHRDSLIQKLRGTRKSYAKAV